MEKYLRRIEKFNVKNQFAMNKSLEMMDKQLELEDIHTTLVTMSKMLELKLKQSNDVRFLRAHLMIEELAETICAMMYCDEVALLDGLADLLYVTLGTALTFDMPVSEALDEVCDSNLTKAKRIDDDPRLRNKGDDWKPPQLKQVLMRHQGVVVPAQRIDCQTQEIEIVDLTVKEEYIKSLGEYYIKIADGDVTGFESIPSRAVKECIKLGWSACAGTKNKRDMLFVPPESMQLIADWLNKSSLKG